jgi:hypothetical protein
VTARYDLLRFMLVLSVPIFWGPISWRQLWSEPRRLSHGSSF